MTINAFAPHSLQLRSFDMEAQKQVPKTYNPTITKIKIAGLALGAAATCIATALLESSNSEIHGTGGHRGLLNHGCTDHQLKAIDDSKRALFISGVTAAAGLGGSILATCLSATESTRIIGTPLMILGSLALGLGVPATVGSGIAYGVLKGKC